MNENELAKIVVDTAFNVHTSLGPGLLESVYQKVMAYELNKRGLQVEEEVAVPVVWDDVQLEVGFRIDLLIDKKLVIELKSVEKVSPVHKKILLTYLRLTDLKLGLLVNFGEELMKTGTSRVVNGLKET